MQILEDDKIKLEILREEKRLLIQGQLQLIQTSKQTIAFLLPLLGFAIDLANKNPVTYLLIPFVILAFISFIMANQNTFNINCGYMDRIDNYIVKKSQLDFPLFQMSIGNAMAEWKFNISSGFGYFIPHAYYILGFASAIVVLSIYLYSVVQGNAYLYRYHCYWYYVGYNVICGIGFAVILYSGIKYARKFKDFREKTIEKKFIEFAKIKLHDRIISVRQSN
jgi:hypothetical protein